MPITTQNPRSALRLLFAFLLFFTHAGQASQEQRLDRIEKTLTDLEAEVAILKEQASILIRRNNLGFLNAFYLKAGLSLIFPRASKFSFQTDTGLGASVGAGKYFGRNHVIDAAFEWDLYPSATLRYRFEFHSKLPALTIGPVVGIKQKLLNVNPIDQFLESPDQVKKQFYLAGVVVAIPMNRSLLNTELIALFNDQFFLVLNASLHFFL